MSLHLLKDGPFFVGALGEEELCEELFLTGVFEGVFDADGRRAIAECSLFFERVF
jgi:hypothetical protein